MTKNEILFERQDWKPEQAPVMATENKIWKIKQIDDYGNKNGTVSDRKIQKEIKDKLYKQFSSIHFISQSSVYFYFKEEADEAEFIMMADQFKVKTDKNT